MLARSLSGVARSLLLAGLAPRLARIRRCPGARILKHVGQAAVAAILPVIVRRHEDTRAARRASRPQPRDLAVAVHLVVLEDVQLYLLVLVLDLLRLGVLLLLALLAAAAQAQHQVQGRLLLDVVVRERAAILKLLAREDQALLVWRDALLVLDLRLDIVNRIGRLHLKGDGLAGQGFHEYLQAGDGTSGRRRPAGQQLSYTRRRQQAGRRPLTHTGRSNACARHPTPPMLCTHLHGSAAAKAAPGSVLGKASGSYASSGCARPAEARTEASQRGSTARRRHLAAATAQAEHRRAVRATSRAFGLRGLSTGGMTGASHATLQQNCGEFY
eukprot:scaffold5705_cov122-Isochrysis_galbana.AAC.5